MPSYYEIADLIKSVLYSDKKRRISNIMPTLLRSYPFANRIVRESTMKEEGGKDIRFNVNVAGASPAQNYTAFQVVQREVGDHQMQGTMQLRGTMTSFSFDTLEEVFNKGDKQIINHIDNREENAMVSLIEKVEAQGWDAAPYAQRDTRPQGLLYWLPYCASEGFVGTYPTNYTDIAGLSPVTYTGWKSYGNVYVGVTQDDLIRKTRRALSETKFMRPVNPSHVDDYSTGYKFNLYCNLDTSMECEDLARAQNDNHGADLDSYNGRAMIRGIPFTEVPYLGSTSFGDAARDPVIGANWGLFKNHYLEKYWMKRMVAPQNNAQPLVVDVDIWCQNQLVCYDRHQGGFNIAKAA